MSPAFHPITFSICPRAITEQAIKTAVFGWENFKATSFEDIRKIVTTMPYSSSFFQDYEKLPIIEKDGKKVKESQRKKKNVIGIAPLVIFDIDEGFSIKETQALLDKRKLEYMIVTTKSHGTEKANGEDRFRVIIPLSWSKNPNFNESGLLIAEDKKIRAIQMQELKYLQIELSKELGLFDYVDKSPLLDIARKYVPSPKDAIVITKETGNRLDIQKAGQAAHLEAKREREEQKRKQEIAKQSKAKQNSYASLKKNPYKTYIDFGVLYSLDLGEILMHYEDNQEPTRFYTEGNYTYVHNDTHKYSIIFKEDIGEYQYYDFKSGESGNILTYMKEYFPGISNFEIALEIQNTFKEELGNIKIIKTNPAYYIEPLKKMLKDNKHKTYFALKREYLSELNLAGMKIQKNGIMEVSTLNNGKTYKNFFKLDKENIKEFSELFQEFGKKKETKSQPEDEPDEPSSTVKP